MTTPVISALESMPSLDPGPVMESDTPCEPILTTGELQAEAQARMAARFRQPKIGTREAILAKRITTKADAVAAVDLVAELEGDAELTDHLLTSLRAFLQVD